MKKEKIYFTTHSKNRMDERTDVALVNAKSVAETAFRRGYEFSDFKEPFCTYLKDLSYNSDGRYILKVYKDFIYVFESRCGKRLITMYKVPEEYLPADDLLIPKTDLHQVVITLTDTSGKKYYWNEDFRFFGLNEDENKALVFKSQKKAINYIHNNNELKDLGFEYKIDIEIKD